MRRGLRRSRSTWTSSSSPVSSRFLDTPGLSTTCRERRRRGHDGPVPTWTDRVAPVHSDYARRILDGPHMNIRNRAPSGTGMRQRPFLLVVAACLLLPGMAGAQGLTGALIGTVKDAQGGVLSGAVVRISSPALIGGPQTLK